MAKELLSEFAPEQLAEFFEYLDELRDSGQTNMFGSRPYLARQFSLSGDVAGAALSAWMKTFSLDVTPLARAASALKVAG